MLLTECRRCHSRVRLKDAGKILLGAEATPVGYFREWKLGGEKKLLCDLDSVIFKILAG